MLAFGPNPAWREMSWLWDARRVFVARAQDERLSSQGIPGRQDGSRESMWSRWCPRRQTNGRLVMRRRKDDHSKSEKMRIQASGRSATEAAPNPSGNGGGFERKLRAGVGRSRNTPRSLFHACKCDCLQFFDTRLTEKDLQHISKSQVETLTPSQPASVLSHPDGIRHGVEFHVGKTLTTCRYYNGT